jgi:6-phosphogluconolactonase
MKILMFVGSANRFAPYAKESKGKGISAFRIDLQTGAAEPLGSFGEIDNPAFIAVSPDGETLAAVSELAGAVEGKISTLSIDRATGGLHLLATQTSAGFTPAHLSFDGTGRFMAVANYGDVPASSLPGQSIAVYRLGPDGHVGAPIASATHTGRGADKSRQDRPHAHCVRWTPDNRFVVVADLGIDRLVTYRFDETAGAIERHGELALPPGSGPRHFAFHPGKPFAYVAAELSSMAASLAFDAAAGEFKLLSVEPSLPAGTYRPSYCSAIAVSPDGKHLFAGNRGHDSIARFDIGGDGIARFIKTTPSGGATPRDFALDPSGRILAVANQESDVVTLFRHESGALTPLATIATGTPTAIAFYPTAS